MIFPRESGVLLHITSLPGKYGLGEIGPHAYSFVDALLKMGQRLWQILPTGDTGPGYSPYATVSAFANNPLLISFDLLVNDNLLNKKELDSWPKFSDNRVDFDSVVPARLRILNLVSDRFNERASKETKFAFAEFCENNAYWLDNYALFITLKEVHNGAAWNRWKPQYIRRESKALQWAVNKYHPSIQRLKILQFIFEDQWNRLRKYAHEKGLKIIGDVPIYIAHDSADVWVQPESFQLDDQGDMVVQSGCPPDYFLETGQLWGNPIYNWATHEKSGFQWWVCRLRKLYKMVDIIRIDHFNGLTKYWEVPNGLETAENGRWVKGPGEKIFESLFEKLGPIPIIAEDLGEAAGEAASLRNQFELPGMKILQFSFDPLEQDKNILPRDYLENCVVYTGTHDNDTTIGWFYSKTGKEMERTMAEIEKELGQVTRTLETKDVEINWDMIALALSSNANTVIVPLQDILGLGSEARMNIPGTVEGNWAWRFAEKSLSDGIAQHMYNLTKKSFRID